MINNAGWIIAVLAGVAMIIYIAVGANSKEQGRQARRDANDRN